MKALYTQWITDMSSALSSYCQGNPQECQRHAEQNYLEPDSFLICITTRPFIDQWFSHEDRRSSIISLSGWEQQYAPPSLKSYIIYQLAQALLHSLADISQPILDRLFHQPPQGCLMDFVSDKPEIKLGMIAGNLCPICHGNLRRLGAQS